MKRFYTLAPILCSALLLSACVFPVQRVSPDPILPGTEFYPVEGEFTEDTEYMEEADFPDGTDLSDGEIYPEDEAEDSDAITADLSEPKLAVFWYAMADARVFEMREVFGPVLDETGIPWKEYDAENDPSRQAEQFREAVEGGCNILAVQLTDSSSPADAAELTRLADGRPVLFFDRIPDFGGDGAADGALPESARAALLCISPEDLWLTQGSMAGNRLNMDFAGADRNGDGAITYTVLVGSDETENCASLAAACVGEADALLTDAGYPALQPVEGLLPDGYRHVSGFGEASDAGNSMMTEEIAQGLTAELIFTDSPDTALGALTALQSAWYNLGGSDGEGNVPLFCVGSSAGASAAVDLGQITGAVTPNDRACASAVGTVAESLASGSSLREALRDLADASPEYSVGENTAEGLPVLYIAPLPYTAPVAYDLR